MQRTVDINTSYEKLPLVNPEAPRVESRRSKAGKTPSAESVKQDSEDAEKIMNQIDLGVQVKTEDKIDANEKYLIDTMPGKPSKPASMGPGGLRKPHYTRIFALDNRMVFQAACCMPLRVIAANLDGDTVSGKVLYSTHSDNEGGKLVYEFQGEGSELIIDVKRGDSTRAQRLIFTI
ncbi:MAG: hypothetical protein H8D23_21525 [Candidatus Brocadiales bacterium]|nr:hypothetical protein [Candidatus Brocadiales bacterium]